MNMGGSGIRSCANTSFPNHVEAKRGERRFQLIENLLAFGCAQVKSAEIDGAPQRMKRPWIVMTIAGGSHDTVLMTSSKGVRGVPKRKHDVGIERVR